MNTTDEQFRATLAHALDDAASDLAPLEVDALVTAGSRRVRHQRIATGAAAMVGVLALGGGGWALLNQPRTPQVAEPAPTASPTALPSAPADQTPSSATLDLINANEPDVAHRFEVRYTPGDAEPLAWYHLVDGTEKLVATSPPPTPGQSRVFMTPDVPGVVLGVVPDDSVQATLMAGDEARWLAGGGPGVVVPGSGLSAVAWLAQEGAGVGETLYALWFRADGTPVTDQGTGHALRVEGPVPTPVTVWTLPANDFVGVDITARRPHGSGDDRFSILDAYLTLASDPAGPYSAELHTVVLFDGTVSDVTALYSVDGLENRQVHVQPWPEQGMTAVVANADVPREMYDPSVHGGEPSLAGFTWTDAEGVRQEWRP